MRYNTCSPLLVFILSIYALNKCNAQWKEFKDTVLGTGCLITITPKLTTDCLQAYDNELNARFKQDRDEKVLCCAYLSLESCVVKIAEKECNKEGEGVAKSFLKTINRSITSDDCIDYGLMACIAWTPVAIGGALALVILLLLSSICWLLVSMKRIITISRIFN
ncbi:unnamed protein product [Medioppia subpectinata]|uniref:Uncharacterized protein n=1 Tax=Medioppia subpectinata TaxID=1979941 RepID=A0A7R9LDZ1_9ACAR|nr:unnamed protein product [Medioppia subpectinata]CAG2118024.1 unnamed protein product [Medioppia subpectinata]